MNILKWFKKNTEKINEDNSINSLILTLDKNNNAYINVKIENLSDDAAIAYADLLCSLTSGLYNKSILDTLMEVGSKDISIFKFIEKIVISWAANSEIEKNNKKICRGEPQVKPTSFNKIAK